MKAAHLMIVNPSNETPSSHDVTLSNALLLEPVALDTPRPGFLRQLYRYVYRGVLQHLKHRIFLNDMLMNLIGGAIMGIVTCGGPLFVNAVPGIYTGKILFEPSIAPPLLFSQCFLASQATVLPEPKTSAIAGCGSRSAPPHSSS